MDKEKLKTLKGVTEKINKDFGDGTIQMMNEHPAEIEAISTGSISLDKALGIGGLPKGGFVEIYGPESSGKTTLAIHVMAEAQKKGYACAIIDMEHAFDRKYAEALGVDVNDLFISQPDYGEQGLEVADRLISSGAIDVIVIDSVAALVPKGELEGEMGDAKMGLQARMMGQALRKLNPIVGANKVLCIFINQIREKIGVMFGNPETTSGGNALKFYAKVRLDIRRSFGEKGQLKDGEELVGNKIKVRVIKNKVAPPFKVAEFDILYGVGIDKQGELLDEAIELGIVEKAGSWISYNGTKVQGVDKFKALMLDNPDFMAEIKNKIENYGK